jgi:hypothetical protein
MPNPTKLSTAVRGLYAVCMAGAAFNHARIVAEHGLFWDYGGIAPFYAVFWTSLTFIDTLAVLLLLVRPRAGLALTAATIIIDVLVNATAGLRYGFDWAAFDAQCLFLVIVLATIAPAWRGFSTDFNRASRS